MKKKIILTLLFVFLSATIAEAKHLHKEAEYQAAFCNKVNGEMEYKLDNMCRVDCLTSTHAIELDFAPKWAESIGQSLYYSAITGKKAGIVLILENGSADSKYLERLRIVAEPLNIDIWTIAPEELNCNKGKE